MTHRYASLLTTLAFTNLSLGCILTGNDETGGGTSSAPDAEPDSSGVATTTVSDDTTTSPPSSSSDENSSSSDPTTADSSSSDDGSTTDPQDCSSPPPGVHEVVWLQTFEEGPGDWSIEGGVWQIGEPTAQDSPAAHGGSGVASTGLDGDYPDGLQSARLVSPEFVVPSADENPQLRIWHQHAFATDDYGEIQARIDGGTWQDLPGNAGRVQDIGGSWRQQLVPLAEFAGSSIEVAFHFRGAINADDGAALGWHLDDIALETGPMAFDCFEGFEDGFGDWSVEGGVWARGEPTAEFAPEPFSGSYLMGTGIDDEYPDGIQDARLVSPQFRVPGGATNPQLRLQQWYQFTGDDYGEIQIRASGGDWDDIEGGLVQDDSGGWTQQIIDLDTYDPSTILQIGFRFRAPTNSDNNGTAPGWFVDDVTLETE